MCDGLSHGSLTALSRLSHGSPTALPRLSRAWRAAGAQSFALESRTRPRLWDGAFSPQEKYTQADVAALVEHARERGVGAGSCRHAHPRSLRRLSDGSLTAL